MDFDLQAALLSLAPKRVLDIATGNGQFLHSIASLLTTYEELVGIDLSPQAVEMAKQHFILPQANFFTMNGNSIEYTDESFDLVLLSNSIHHFDQPEAVLREAMRVLKPQGALLIQEMVSDNNQTPAQLTHMLLHHWWAEIDSASGIPHHPTYTEAALRKMLSSYNFAYSQTMMNDDLDGEVMDPELIERLQASMESYFEKAKQFPDVKKWENKGKELKHRLQETGFAPARRMLFYGIKQQKQ